MASHTEQSSFGLGILGPATGAIGRIGLHSGSDISPTTKNNPSSALNGSPRLRYGLTHIIVSDDPYHLARATDIVLGLREPAHDGLEPGKGGWSVMWNLNRRMRTYMFFAYGSKHRARAGGVVGVELYVKELLSEG